MHIEYALDCILRVGRHAAKVHGPIVRIARRSFIEAFVQKTDGMDKQRAMKIARKEWITSSERARLIEEMGPTEAKRRRLS